MKVRSTPSRRQNEKGTSAAPEKPVNLRAIQETLRALEDRGRYYRNLIVAVVVISAASLLLALLFLRWTPLLGFILLQPLVGGFMLIDSRRVRRWGSEILQMRRVEHLDFPAFQNNIRKWPQLPTHALTGMLATLPAEESSAPSTEATLAALAERFERSARRQERTILGATILLTLALSGLVGAILFRSGALLLGGLLCLIIFAVLRKK